MWIALAIFASILQVLRNSFQRGLMNDAGVWAATWVRFAFGVPISLIVLLVLFFFRGNFNLHIELNFFLIASIGALAQVMATAALLKSMHSSSFALGATLQHSSLLITALFGFVFLGDKLNNIVWFGFICATIGMVISSWPKNKLDKAKLKETIYGGLFGLLSGACFAVSANCFRSSVLMLESPPSLFSSCFTVCYVQFVQALGIGIFLYAFEKKNFIIALKSWRESLSAGAAGASSSIIWFLVLALVPAALARTVNLLIEAPFSIIIGMVKFKERASFQKIVAITLIVIGVILAINGG